MRKRKGLFSAALAFLLCAVCVIPFVFVFVASLRDPDGGFSFMAYYKVFLANSAFLFRFWKSLGLSLAIALAQVFVSALAGYGFAKYHFRGKNALFFLLMILMILPLQVTLVPNYIILEKTNLLNTYWSLALPAITFPLGTFILRQSFRALPNSVLEAARVDGCGLPRLLVSIVVPMSKNALICVFLLSFLDAWNMVEQPITYLKEFADYPFGVALASAPLGNPTVMLAACVLAALPPLFLFAFFNRELTEGIALGGEQ